MVCLSSPPNRKSEADQVITTAQQVKVNSALAYIQLAAQPWDMIWSVLLAKCAHYQLQQQEKSNEQASSGMPKFE